MDSQDKKPLYRFFKGFYYAWQGILYGAKKEANFKFHLTAAIVVCIAAFYFSITKIEWLFVLIAIGGMLTLELINSAIEKVVDLVTGEYHPLAKAAKDLAAGAVLVYAILSAIIGFIIFLPKIWSMLV
jgi:undecaprenol kinase